MTSVLSALVEPPEAEERLSRATTLVSVLIPLEEHRNLAERSLRAWCVEQTLNRDRYEVIVVAPRDAPARRLDAIRRLLGKHDRLVITTARHDVRQVTEAAELARGELLFFSESHVWPEPDVLERCIERMDERPDWSALICGLKRVTVNRLGDVEADMYERDFWSGSSELRWRNINDACLCTRRAAYFDVGGFDAGLGHFAEWVFAARYATAGFVVGHCPDIEMWHLYPGDVATLRHFTEDFTKGEIAYLARDPADRDETFIEAPIEWSSRGERRADLARHIVAMVAAETRRALIERRPANLDWRHALTWLPVVVFGGALTRARAEIDVIIARAGLIAATRFQPRPALAVAFERYVSAIIRRARLRSTDAFCKQSRWTESGELWSAFPEMAGNAAGLHAPEEYEDVLFSWSEPAAVVAIDLGPGRYCIHVNTLQVQLADEMRKPEFYVNGKPIPDERIALDENVMSFSIDVPSSEKSWLGWICSQTSAPGDLRQLGLPVVSLLATIADV
jgi:hypothetical protein